MHMQNHRIGGSVKLGIVLGVVFTFVAVVAQAQQVVQLEPNGLAEMTSTAAISISGQVLGEGPHGDTWPLSTTGNYVYVVLWRYDSGGIPQYVNGTDCYDTGQGCANPVG